MTPVEQAATDRAAQNEAYRIAASKRDAAWPRTGGFTVCRGLANSCDTGHPATNNGWCDVCNKRIITLAIKGYAIHPLPVLRVSYATYRAKTPQSAPKHGRKIAKPAPVQQEIPAERPGSLVLTSDPPRIFADGVPVAFPDVKAALERKHEAQAARVVVPAQDQPFGKWQALVNDGKRILAAPAETMPTPATYTQLESWLNEAREELATIKKNLNSRAFLTAQIARLDERLAEIAKLRQRLAELENE